jgi:hypothetical protein
MERYDFKLRRDEETIVVFRSIALEEMRDVWAMVASLAQDVGDLGGRIVVTNQAGEVVILVGVATARSYPVTVKDMGVARAAREAA